MRSRLPYAASKTLPSSATSKMHLLLRPLNMHCIQLKKSSPYAFIASRKLFVLVKNTLPPFDYIRASGTPFVSLVLAERRVAGTFAGFTRKKFSKKGSYMKKFDFQQAIEVVLLRHGAFGGGDTSEWQLETRAGQLAIQVHDAGIECAFTHPLVARAIVQHGEVDLASGCWYWQFDSLGEQNVEVFEQALIAVLDQEEEAALPPLAKSARKLNAQLRASGRKIKVTKGLVSNELIATFPQGRSPR